MIIMKKTVFFLLVFLVVGGYIISTNLDTNFDDTGQKITFARAFFGWVFEVTDNVKDTVGFAAEKNWLPEVNDTNNTNSSEN